MVASALLAQNAVNPPGKPTPATIGAHLFLIGESVVQQQWTHTLKLVNAPQNITLLNPGQCIRVAIYATGDNRDAYLENTQLSFEVKFAGKTQDYPLAPLAQIKQIKPEGGDFVTGALGAAGIQNPLLTMASMGVSGAAWCVPADAKDGEATVDAEVESPGGHKKLHSSDIQIESFETGSKHAFKDDNEFSDFLQTYYRQPNPARLLPAIEFIIGDAAARSRAGVAESTAAFLSAALKADPVAAKDLQARILAEPPGTRVFGLLLLRTAGYDVSGSLASLSAAEQEKFKAVPPLPDPYDIPMTPQAFTRLDMMWAVFGATGQFEPVSRIASTLEWRSDYDAFDKLRKSGQRPSELTPSIVRGLTYAAAGWAMGSFQRNDPLVADYIEYMLASPDVSPAIKTELKGLQTNPAFQRPSGD